MPSNVYRYSFGPDVALADIENLLIASVMSIEHLHGEAAARLDARFYLDEERRCCVIDATSPIGIELNKLFAGALAREFGPDSFKVERVDTETASPLLASA